MKGSDIERELEQILSSSGLHLVHRTRQVRTPPRIGADGKKVWGVALSADIFGVFDFLVVGRGSLAEPFWIQCCSAGAASAHRKKLEGFWERERIPWFNTLRRSAVLATRYPGVVWRWQTQQPDRTWRDTRCPVEIIGELAARIKPYKSARERAKAKT